MDILKIIINFYYKEKIFKTYNFLYTFLLIFTISKKLIV